MEAPTSYGLISRMRRDSGIPWEDFHRRYHVLIQLYGKGKGLTSEEQDELVNDVLMELFHQDKRSLYRYDPARGLFRHYLKTIASRRAIDLLRRRREEHLPLQDDVPDLSERVPDLEKEEETEHRRMVIAEALQELKLRCSPRNMQVFLAYVVQERPAEAVALEFDISLSNVYAMKSRMQKEFRAICREAEKII